MVDKYVNLIAVSKDEEIEQLNDIKDDSMVICMIDDDGNIIQ